MSQFRHVGSVVKIANLGSYWESDMRAMLMSDHAYSNCFLVTDTSIKDMVLTRPILQPVTWNGQLMNSLVFNIDEIRSLHDWEFVDPKLWPMMSSPPSLDEVGRWYGTSDGDWEHLATLPLTSMLNRIRGYQ